LSSPIPPYTFQPFLATVLWLISSSLGLGWARLSCCVPQHNKRSTRQLWNAWWVAKQNLVGMEAIELVSRYLTTTAMYYVCIARVVFVNYIYVDKLQDKWTCLGVETRL
jgi:hypothetical protein